MVLQLEGAGGRRSGVMGNPIKFKDADEEERRYPPDLGADTRAVLSEALNLSNEEIVELIRLKAIVAKDFTR
jgi:crotonobetainyl-CoA:carnitine CoA-transferase CaiB-like acyl-CoA transferase